MCLNGRVALITGASRGIGLSIAKLLADKGMSVALNARSSSVKKEANDLRSNGHNVAGYVADITDIEKVDQMVSKIERDLGSLWLLVNNAGTLSTGSTTDLDEEDWNQDMDVIAKGTFLCSQAAIRRMIPRSGGRIINISSIAGVIVRTNQIAYCSAKAAVNHFTRCLSVEMAPHGITVNAICPGMTYTKMLAQSLKENQISIDSVLNLIPAGKMADPINHASLIAYLATEEAAHITGQVISVDGAQSLYMPLSE